MTRSEALLMEFEREADKTRKMLERVPLDKADWKPHEKSFTLGRLASHVAEIPGWANVTLNQDELDFSKTSAVHHMAAARTHQRDPVDRHL